LFESVSFAPREGAGTINKEGLDMKKVLLTLLCVLLTVSFAGCGEKQVSAPAGEDAVETEKQEAGSESMEQATESKKEESGSAEKAEDAKKEESGSEEKKEDAKKEESGSEEK
jgi:hypothetical protein